MTPRLEVIFLDAAVSFSNFFFFFKKREKKENKDEPDIDSCSAPSWSAQQN